MTFPLEAPCGLVATGGCCPDWAAADPDLKDIASARAAKYLWAASGRIYGECPRTVRPCGDNCSDYSTYWGPSEASSYMPVLLANGNYINCRTGSCHCNPCDCCYICGIELEWPASSIAEVKIDGMVVDESEYFIYDRKKLVKRVGCFPTCQNLALPSTEEGTFEVTYNYGLPLDVAGQAALDSLACEFLKQCLGQACKLPTRWRTLTREGITMEAFDDLAVLDQGRIGILEVDSWLAAVNPNRAQAMPYIPRMGATGTRLLEQTWP